MDKEVKQPNQGVKTHDKGKRDLSLPVKQSSGDKTFDKAIQTIFKKGLFPGDK